MKLRRAVAAACAAVLSLTLAGAGLSTSTFSPRQGRIAGIVPPIGKGVHQFDAPQGSGNLVYHGGSVMRTNTTYAIYWLPSGYSYEGDNSGYESLINQFFADVAHDSGLNSNVYASTPQYYDTVGGGTHPSAYASTFGGSVVVTDPLPAGSECDNSAWTSFCVLDSTLRAEIKNTVEAQGWPEDTNHMYFLFTPPNLGNCFDATDCSYAQYCAYHSAFSGSSGTIVYANQPWTKGMDCDMGEYPNGSGADPTINVVSHEHIEAITDPTLSAWWDAAGYEIGDKCAWGFGPQSGAAGAQYNQTINGHDYLLQEEYDNATSSCIQAVGASAPSVAGLLPTSGPVGTAVTITGAHFTGATEVDFNGTAATTWSVDSDTQITADVPAGATTGAVAVIGPGGTGTGGTFTVSAPVPAPSVTTFLPASGPIGATVTITGTHFTGVTEVDFNGTPATVWSVDSDTQLTADVPAGATSGPLAVVGPGGTGTGSTFTVTPTIAGFAPTSAPAGADVTITGSGLTGATAVKFGATNAAGFTVDSDTQITAMVPAGAKAATISVTTPGGTATSSGTFGPIAITSFSPTKGKPGTLVTITGTGLLGALGVSFGGVAASTFTVVSSTKITAKPAPGTITGAVTVATAGGTATSSAQWSPFPEIDSFTPTRAPGGTAFTITGVGFTGATRVAFNGKPAVVSNVVSDTQITATLPGSANSGKISVTTRVGTATSSQTFDIVAIRAVAPGKGKPGTTVTITGSGFANTTDVQFHGQSAVSFKVVSDKKVTAVVPVGAVHGFVDVLTADGQAESPQQFAIVPAVTGLSAASAPVGKPLVIDGSGFTDATVVRFGTTKASFSVDSDGQITATVPSGIGTTKVTVVGPGGTATSHDTFRPLAVKSFTPAGGDAGTLVTILGTGFSGATSVTFAGVAATFTVVSDTKATALVPACGLVGQIAVVGPGGTAESAATFAGAPC